MYLYGTTDLEILKNICVGKWIHQNMGKYINNQKVGVFFPYLVKALCKKAGAPMTSIEQPLKPSRSIFRDILFQQYIKLQAKQAKDCNKQQKEMSATPTSSKSLARAQQDVGENSHPKLDWMI
ncbi:hypothetical protein PVK06_030702 [Gossypium arboreum]|uniref:Uncharacterized protein n=1 Tax=Gossypium arboreum TaxID=29729 RepID=A0ABR0NPX0_GOSAR|nr:hypothetical protein PVK06_030702 [Gossypium arboreum]